MTCIPPARPGIGAPAVCGAQEIQQQGGRVSGGSEHCPAPRSASITLPVRPVQWLAPVSGGLIMKFIVLFWWQPSHHTSIESAMAEAKRPGAINILPRPINFAASSVLSAR